MKYREKTFELSLSDGRTIPLRVRPHAGARRMSLRVDPSGGEIRLTIPNRTAIGEGIEFVEKELDWIQGKLAELKRPVPFAEGAILPLLGHDHEIRLNSEGKRGVWCEDGVIWVSGRAEHLRRRVQDFIKKTARDEIGRLAWDKAAKIDQKPRRITVRDTRSRWGSCSSKGDLSFSWRLVFAPYNVLDYVVAHEVAHLVEHNHSARFWQLTDSLSDHQAPAKEWLRKHGRDLWRYGVVHDF